MDLRGTISNPVDNFDWFSIFWILLIIVIVVVFFLVAYRALTKRWFFVEERKINDLTFTIFQSRNKKRFCVTSVQGDSEVYFNSYDEVIYYLKSKNQ